MKVNLRRNKSFDQDVSFIVISDTEETDNDTSVIVISDSDDDYNIFKKRKEKKPVYTHNHNNNNNYNKKTNNENDEDVIFICEKAIEQKQNESLCEQLEFELLPLVENSENIINQVEAEPSSSQEMEKHNKIKHLEINDSMSKNHSRISLQAIDILNKLNKREGLGGDDENYDLPSLKNLKKSNKKGQKKVKIDLESINVDLNSTNNVYDLPSLNIRQNLNLKDFIYKKYFQINNHLISETNHQPLSDQIENIINANLASSELLYVNEVFVLLKNLAEANLLDVMGLEKIFDLFKKLDSIEETTKNIEQILFFYKNFHDLVQSIVKIGFNYELLMKNSHLWKEFLSYLTVLIDKCTCQQSGLMFKVHVLKMKIFTELMFIYVKFVYEIKLNNFLSLNNSILTSKTKFSKMNWLSFQQLFSINELEIFFVNLTEKFKTILLPKHSKWYAKW